MEVKPLSFSDHVIATDILFETKAAIKDLSVAITERRLIRYIHFFVKNYEVQLPIMNEFMAFFKIVAFTMRTISQNSYKRIFPMQQRFLDIREGLK
jgi:hypothetical protein